MLKLLFNFLLLCSVCFLTACSNSDPLFYKISWFSVGEFWNLIFGVSLALSFLAYISVPQGTKGRLTWAIVVFCLLPGAITVWRVHDRQVVKEAAEELARDPEQIRRKAEFQEAKAVFDKLCKEKAKYEVYESVQGVTDVIYGPGEGDSWDDWSEWPGTFKEVNSRLWDQYTYNPINRYQDTLLNREYYLKSSVKQIWSKLDLSFNERSAWTPYPRISGNRWRLSSITGPTLRHSLINHNVQTNYGVYLKATDISLRSQWIAGLHVYAYQIKPFKLLGEIQIYKFDKSMGYTNINSGWYGPSSLVCPSNFSADDGDSEHLNEKLFQEFFAKIFSSTSSK